MKKDKKDNKKQKIFILIQHKGQVEDNQVYMKLKMKVRILNFKRKIKIQNSPIEKNLKSRKIIKL